MSRTVRGGRGVLKPKYQRNPTPRTKGTGRRIRDDVSGAWTYEDNLVTDEYGSRVDPAFGTYDVRREIGGDRNGR